jgi:hypothetical protein
MEVITRGLGQEESGHKRLTAAIGLVLLGMGIIGVVWIAHALITLSTAPRAIPLMEKFLAFDNAARSIGTPDGPVQLPEGLYFAVGVFLYILVLGIAAMLAKALIVSGTKLVQLDVTPLLNRLRDEIRGMKEHWEKRNS